MRYLAGAVFFTLAAIPASTTPAAAEGPPAVMYLSFDQATVEADFVTPRITFNVNSANVVTDTPHDERTTTSQAVASVFQICDGSGCDVYPNQGTCYPAGNEWGDAALPEGALSFGPGPGAARLTASFDCHAGAFVLNLDLTWSGKDVVGTSGGPAVFNASVTGSASDGVTELVDAETVGAVIHRTETVVVRP
jgi:hypothetical protein